MNYQVILMIAIALFAVSSAQFPLHREEVPAKEPLKSRFFSFQRIKAEVHLDVPEKKLETRVQETNDVPAKKLFKRGRFQFLSKDTHANHAVHPDVPEKKLETRVQETNNVPEKKLETHVQETNDIPEKKLETRVQETNDIPENSKILETRVQETNDIPEKKLETRVQETLNDVPAKKPFKRGRFQFLSKDTHANHAVHPDVPEKKLETRVQETNNVPEKKLETRVQETNDVPEKKLETRANKILTMFLRKKLETFNDEYDNNELNELDDVKEDAFVA